MPENDDQRDQLVQHVSFAAGSLALLRQEDGAPVTDDDGDWIVEGLAIPYGVELQRIDWQTGATRWTFEHVEPTPNAKLYFGHDHLTDGLPIGRVVEHQQLKDGDAPGLFLRAKISRTAKGAEVRTLLQDGVLDRFSVGLDRQHPDTKTRVEDADSDDPLLVFEHVPAWETSVVPLPAYDQAKISAVLDGRNRKEHKMPENDEHGTLLQELRDGQETLSGELQQLQRQVVTLGAGHGDAGDAIVRPAAPTYGDWLQQLAAGDQNALDFLAFVGSETADLDAISDQVAWVDDLRRSAVERRPITQLFRRRPLPNKGMHVGYGRVLNDGTVQVGVQANEGDLLPYGKLAFDAGATTPVLTAGGWTDMSRQVIERSDVNIVEDFFRVAFNRYLRVTEGAVRTLASSPANATAASGAANDLTTADGWIDFLVDAAFYLDDNGHPLDFLAVSRDRFKMLAKLRDGDAADAPRLLDRNSGRINVTGLNGDMFGVTVVPLNVAGDVVRAGSADAITFWEDGRAPFRLQDDDITNLTKAFSLYGYYALASTDATALVKPAV